MIQLARKLAFALFLMAAAAVALASVPVWTSAQGSGLLEFDDFECPGPCPVGADTCCAFLPPLCVPDPCKD